MLPPIDKPSPVMVVGASTVVHNSAQQPKRRPNSYNEVKRIEITGQRQQHQSEIARAESNYTSSQPMPNASNVAK